MRPSLLLLTATLTLATGLAEAAECRPTPKEVVTQFMTKFYLDKKVREAFETWVEPGYIQHNPMAATGRDAAIALPRALLPRAIRMRTTRSSASSPTAISSPCIRTRSSPPMIAASRWWTSCGSRAARSPSTGTSPSRCPRRPPTPTGCSDALRRQERAGAWRQQRHRAGRGAGLPGRGRARSPSPGATRRRWRPVAAASGMLAVRSDISSVADSRAAIGRLAGELGGIDVLFVNAGVGGFAQADGGYRGILGQHPQHRPAGRLLRAPGGAAAPARRRQHRPHRLGRAAAGPCPGRVAYAAAKAGLARRGARPGRRTAAASASASNVVSPGPTETEIFKRGADRRAGRGGALPAWPAAGADAAHGRARGSRRARCCSSPPPRRAS